MQTNIPTVYIDGSCIRNGAASAQAGIGIFWGPDHPWNCGQSLHEEELTNNKAEMRAAIRAIEVAKEHDVGKLIIKSDSNYVIRGVTEWVHKWQENQWKTSDGENVKNKEIWIKLLNLIQNSKIHITWEHVSAHSGIYGNEEADRLAMNAAKSLMQSDTASESKPTITPPCESEKQNISNLEPRVLIIPKKTCTADDTGLSKQPLASSQTTPSRRIIIDKSETPVPGSVNGFSIKSDGFDDSKRGRLQINPKCIQKPIDDEQTVKCIKNVEVVLQSVMAEIHELRQHQMDFKTEMKEQLNQLQVKQQLTESSFNN